MKNRLVNSRAVLLVLLAAVIAAFWSLPARAVTYGTHSKAYTPVVSSPMCPTSSPTVSMRSTSSLRMMTEGVTVSPIASTVPGSSQSYGTRGKSRKAKPTEPGTGGASRQDDVDPSIWWYWDDEEEDWVADIPVGTVKEEDGYYWEWNGSAWVIKGQIADLGTPVGDAPWWLMLVLLLAYGVAKKVGFRRNNG